MALTILDKIKTKYVWVSLRLGMGWLLFWGFIDKLFGLGFSTTTENAWINGGSPTTGYLQYAVGDMFGHLFEGLAGVAAVDWLFMLGLLLIGGALILGVGVKIAAYSGSLLMLLFWLSALPLEHNPIIDDHIIYIALLIGLAKVNAGQWFGLGQWWQETKLVKKYPILE